MTNTTLISFVKDRRNSFAIAALIYLVFMIIGMFFAKHTGYFINYKQISWLSIFSHNMVLAFALVFTGWITFGISNSIATAINGAFFGNVLMGIWNRYGFCALQKVIFPHAVIEILATILFSALGYEVYYFVSALRGEKTYHIRNVLIFAMIGTILMLIASIIEGLESI
ncbi:hypothetical protein FCS83_06685 [Oenococcus sp. UCMA 17063]|nr:hypothetical protein [Oenococcus sp. UCMA 17063]